MVACLFFQKQEKEKGVRVVTEHSKQQRAEAVKKAGEILREIQMEKQKMIKQTLPAKTEAAEELTNPAPPEAGKQKEKKQNNPRGKAQNQEKAPKRKFSIEGLHWKNIAICCIVLWVALVGVGAFSMHLIINGNYSRLQSNVDQALKDLQMNNETAITAMTERVDAMDEKLGAITASMENTGAAISSSSQSSREEMAKQIETLQKELKSLQESLKILQEKGKR